MPPRKKVPSKGKSQRSRLARTRKVALGPAPVAIQLQVNGQKLAATVEPWLTLLQALRENLGLTGAKQVCDHATCGACTVLANGKRVYACSMLAVDSQDLQITTIESLAANGRLNPLQRAFIDADASQCGYCTSGFIMSATAFLAEIPHPTLNDVKKGMCGNICRCGTYAGIAEALLSVSPPDASSEMRGRRRG
jgi:xanthine dehydrogenase YagT iron-sulfur-binding subunit